MIKTFTGFRGVVMFLQIGKVHFMILAEDNRQAEAIYNHVMPEAEPFDPAMCKKGLLFEAKNLPESAAKTAAERATPKSRNQKQEVIIDIQTDEKPIDTTSENQPG